MAVAAGNHKRQGLTRGDISVDAAGVEPVVEAAGDAAEIVVLNGACSVNSGCRQKALLILADGRELAGWDDVDRLAVGDLGTGRGRSVGVAVLVAARRSVEGGAGGERGGIVDGVVCSGGIAEATGRDRYEFPEVALAHEGGGDGAGAGVDADAGAELVVGGEEEELVVPIEEEGDLDGPPTE